MSLAPAAALSPAEVERGLRLVIRDGVCTQILITLVGGVFLTDFALGLGAGSLALGTIMAMPALGNLFQLPAIALVEALRRRRAIVVAMSGPARLLFFVVVALPFLPILPQTAVAVLIAALAAIYALGSISHCAWNSWMRDLVPPARLGGFFGRRMMVMAALGAVLVPLAGFYVDGFRSAWPDLRSYVYAPLFATGAAAGVIGVWILALTPEPAMAPTAETEGFARRVLAPLRDPDFRGVLVFLFAWNATVNLAAPFFAAYMLTRLGLDVGQATLLTAIFQLANLVAYGPWGRIADRRTNRAVLGVCVPVFMAAIPGFVVAAIPTVPTLALAWLFALHVALGFAHAGRHKASASRRIDLLSSRRSRRGERGGRRGAHSGRVDRGRVCGPNPDDPPPATRPTVCVGRLGRTVLFGVGLRARRRAGRFFDPGGRNDRLAANPGGIRRGTGRRIRRWRALADETGR
jgi:MFS family permease